MTARRPDGAGLRRDEAGAFLVVEAILVAIMVLTAVLFFTSVQRPTGGTESRGVDLGQLATDTLAILQRRTFTTAPTGDPEGWVNQTLGGDTAIAQAVDSFLDQVLPTGAKHLVRLSNGVGTLPLLPATSPGLPQGARAAEVPLFPHWRTFVAQAATDLAVPGQQLTSAGNPVLAHFTDPADPILCIKAPYGVAATSLWRTPVQRSGTVSGSTFTIAAGATTVGLEPGMRVQGTGVASGTTVAAVPTSTTVTLSQAAVSGAATLSFYANRVPAGAVYGTWAGYTAANCTGTAVYAAVVLPGARALTGVSWTTTSKTLTATAAAFSASDVGRLVVGSGIPGGTTVAAYNSTTAVTMTAKPTAAGTNTAATLAPDPAYPVYGLQLVVWFGA